MPQTARPQPRITKRTYSHFKKTILNDVPRMTQKPLPSAPASTGDALYRQIFESTRTIKLIIDPLSTQILEANPAACQFYGYPLEQFKTLHISDINILSNDEVKIIRHGVADGTRTTFQTHHRLASGAIRDVEVYSGTLIVADKTYVYADIHDITDRLQAEKDLHEGEALYRLLAQNMPNTTVIMFDRDMRYTLAEGPYMKRVGSQYKNMVGKFPRDVLSENSLAFLLPIYERALQGESFDYEREGDDFAYKAYITPLRNTDGHIIGGMILSHDMLETKRAEKALRESEQRYQLVINTLSEGIVVQNQDGVIQTCNPAAERILGLTADQMMGRTSIDPLWRAVHEDGSPFPGETHPAMVTLRTGHPLTNVIMGVYKPDNSLAWISINSRALIHPDQTLPYAVVATFVDITERKQAADDLRASEERLRLITDNVQDVITLTDAENRIIFASPSSKSILGFEPQALLGKLREDFAPPEQQAKLTALRQNLISVRHQQITRQGQLVHADGHIINIETVGKFLFDDQSNYVGSVYITRDITERKRMEQALRASEERLRLITDNITDIVLQSDPIGHIAFVSPSFRSVLGFELNSLLGVSIIEYIHPDDQAQVTQAFQTAVETNTTQFFTEYRLRHADGHYIDVETSSNILQDDQMNFTGAVFVTRDITERKRMEQALRASETKLRLITDNLHDLVTQHDLKGRMVFVSSSSRKMLGYEPESLLGTSALDLLHPDDLAAQRQIFETALEAQSAQFTLEGRMRHADGHYTPVETVGQFVFDDQSNITSGVFISRDITERKRMQNLLLEQEKMQTTIEKEHELNLLKTHMMQRITHEFRTPLTVIQASMETLTYYYDRLTPDQKSEKTAKVKNQIQHITDMLDEIGLVVKGDFEPDYFHPVSTDLSALCREVAASLEAYFSLPHKYVLELPETTPVLADSTVLKTAILHIMRNAARFCEPSAPVTIQLSRLKKSVELRVTDTGIGILPNELPRIFDPFFRGSNINERSGLGVGLTLARAAVAAHGGTITVKSVPLQGTTFTISLPV